MKKFRAQKMLLFRTWKENFASRKISWTMASQYVTLNSFLTFMYISREFNLAFMWISISYDAVFYYSWYCIVGGDRFSNTELSCKIQTEIFSIVVFHRALRFNVKRYIGPQSLFCTQKFLPLMRWNLSFQLIITRSCKCCLWLVYLWFLWIQYGSDIAFYVTTGYLHYIYHFLFNQFILHYYFSA